LGAGSARAPAVGGSGRCGPVPGAAPGALSYGDGPACVGGGGVPPRDASAAGGIGAPGSGRAGATAVGGSWLPPDISAVLASAVADGGGGVSSPGSLSDGANTASGSGTERSAPSAVVSVPAHGAAPAGPPCTA